MEPKDRKEDLKDIIQAAEALLSENDSSPEPMAHPQDLEAEASTSETEPKIGNAADAQAAIRQKLQDEYGDKVEVAVSKAVLESNESDGGKLWLVEGDAKVRRGLFRKKKWHFTYYLDAAEGRIRIVRSSKM